MSHSICNIYKPLRRFISNLQTRGEAGYTSDINGTLWFVYCL